MRHCDSHLHVTGQSRYVDDLPEPEGMLHAAVFGSPGVHGRLLGLDLAGARNLPGVRAVIAFADLPAETHIGAIRFDEPLFAENEVRFKGQPLALVVADDRATARRAVSLCSAAIEARPAVVCPREAFRRGDLFQETRVFEKGAVDEIWDRCATVVEGRIDLGGQEHLYLETNRARATPREDGQMYIDTSSQSPSMVQKHVARVLGVPMHKVEVDVKRLGGGFGGKEDQATHWACMAAVGARITGRPVQLILSRTDDMLMTGKRHPYKQDFKLGLDAEGRILGYEVTHYQNAGAYMDLSGAVLERTVLHSTNAYAIPNVRIRAACCRTNLPPNTAFRGFGGPQGMFPLEAAIEKAAQVTGIPAYELQARNLMEDGYTFHYGQRLEESRMKRTWIEADEAFDFAGTQQRIAAFNAANPHRKKGVAIMPVCFGISFTKTFLNQGSSLVHVYTDGTVAVATGGVEMGQGVSSNMVAIASRVFGISPEKVRSNSTNTSRIANISPSAASATTDLNGNATILACREILAGMLEVAAAELECGTGELAIVDGRVQRGGEATGITWEDLVLKTYFQRRPLMAHGFYTPPEIHYDPVSGVGRPFHYYTFGTCLTEVTVDCLRGTYTIDASRLVHDLGRTIIPTVDRGQIEGGLAQGLGWVTLEELSYADDGRLLSNALSTYKAPDADFMPDEIEIRLLEKTDNPGGPLGSKAVGEPPFMYGIGAFFALRRAVEAFAGPFPGNEEVKCPMTPERVLLSLFSKAGSRPAAVTREALETV